jgi:hypothetical protein
MQATKIFPTSEQTHEFLSYPIPLAPPPDTYPDPRLFLPEEAPRALTRQEKEWVKAARSAPEEEIQKAISTAPTLPALRALEQSLKKYDAPLPASKEAWQAFVMAKYFEQANDIDPKVSKPALDALAKTNIVALHQEVQEININTKTTIELEGELMQKIDQILRKNQEKIIEHTP